MATKKNQEEKWEAADENGAHKKATQKMTKKVGCCGMLPPLGRASFEQGGGGGEGVLDPKLGVPKMA